MKVGIGVEIEMRKKRLYNEHIKEIARLRRQMIIDEEYYDDYEEEEPEKLKEKSKEGTNKRYNSKSDKRRHRRKRKDSTFSGAFFRFVNDKDKYFTKMYYNVDISKKIENYQKYLQKLITDNSVKIKEHMTMLKNEERNNIRVLIIVDGTVHRKPSEFVLNNDFIVNNEFILSAFLLRHIFQYVYKIPEQNILITTSKQHNISDQYKFSPSQRGDSKEYLKGKLTSSEYQRIYNDWTYKYFCDYSFKGIYVAQSEDIEYRFACERESYHIVKPFNRKFLKLLRTDENSKVLIFFLNHDEVGTLPNIDYQFFIERFLELNAKQYIVFNDCSYSGTLIDLIRISEILQSTFQHFSEEQLKTVFNELLSISKELNELKTSIEIKQIIHDEKTQYKITAVSPEFINDTMVENTKSFLSKYQLTKDSTFNEIIGIVKRLTEFSVQHQINPKQFIDFKKKSIIFCSTPFNISNVSLPIHYIHCYPYKHNSIISSRGTFFTSTIIHFLLNPNKELTNPCNFALQINKNFQQLKTLFKDILISQVKIGKKDIQRLQLIPKPKSNYKLSEEEINDIVEQSKRDLEEIDRYFNIHYANENTFIYGEGLELPNFKELILPHQYWSFEERKLLKCIYENHKYYHYDISICKSQN